MKKLLIFILALLITSCAGLKKEEDPNAYGQIGIVNHTGQFIYTALIDGHGGGNMSRWGAGGADIPGGVYPRIWHPGIKVLVRWDMPEEHTHIWKEKIVEIEKFDRPGDVYLHFFPNDEVRVVITNIPGWTESHPIPPPVKPTSTISPE